MLTNLCVRYRTPHLFEVDFESLDHHWLIFFGRTLKGETSVWDRGSLLAPPSSITLSQLPGKNTAEARQSDETDSLILGNNWPTSLWSNICFKYFWRKLCIWQSENLCCVTYSVQFKVPLFLLSAGVGSHRGAVQPLHCRGSDCSGRQRERKIF